MKKTSFILLILCLYCLPSFSQPMGKKAITWNAQAGMTVSKFSNGPEHQMAKIGYNIGVGADIPFYSFFSPKRLNWSSLSFNPSILVITKGNRHERYGYGEDKETIKNNPIYMEIPLRVALTINAGGKLSLSPFIGPYFAFGIGGKHLMDGNYTIMGSPVSGNNDRDFFGDGYGKNFDAGLTAGLRINGQHLFLEMAYDAGFVKAIENSKYHTRCFMLNLGYRF